MLNGTGRSPDAGRNACNEWEDTALNDIQVTRTNDGNADAGDNALVSISDIRTIAIVGH
jgi:hypothetical protein